MLENYSKNMLKEFIEWHDHFYVNDDTSIIEINQTCKYFVEYCSILLSLLLQKCVDSITSGSSNAIPISFNSIHIETYLSIFPGSSES